MEEPAETMTEEKRVGRWSGYVVWAAGILVLYVLSIGPVTLMWRRDFLPPTSTFLWNVYSPLRWAYLKTPLHRPIGMYLHLWDPLSCDKKGEPTNPPQ
jgi:hypothetical protein